MSDNPFVWNDAIEGGVPRPAFAREVSEHLKAGTHVALFGPRGTGKSSFLAELENHLCKSKQSGEGWELLTIDLRRAISLGSFAHAVSIAIDEHPNRKARRRALAALEKTETEFAVNFGVLKTTTKGKKKLEPDEAEVLFANLRAASEIADRIVIAFDEFQRLASCPGEPLSIIRSALMGRGRAGRVSLLLTGSLRERLELMLHTSTEPIWDQTYDLDLPQLDLVALIEYIEDRFQQTGLVVEPRAVEALVKLTDGHPKRSQQLAWHIWNIASKSRIDLISREDVYSALDDLLLPNGSVSAEFDRLLDTLLNGTDTDINNARALLLLASGASWGSLYEAQRFGLNHPTNTKRAFRRLKERGLIRHQQTTWQIVDPLLRIWLERQNPYLIPASHERPAIDPT